jgi:hypothetical protein
VFVHYVSVCDDFDNCNLHLQRQLLLMASVTILLILPGDLMATVGTMEHRQTTSNVLSSMYSKLSCYVAAHSILLSVGVQIN